jgi:hypothetical protein
MSVVTGARPADRRLDRRMSSARDSHIIEKTVHPNLRRDTPETKKG